MTGLIRDKGEYWRLRIRYSSCACLGTSCMCISCSGDLPLMAQYERITRVWGLSWVPAP